MTSKSRAVWGIDLGNNSLKAIRMTDENGVVEVIGFENIEHSKILSSGMDQQERDEHIALALRQFAERNVFENDEIIISMPSQNSFCRFVNLPPVEDKRIPEIVRYEAAQQIPFDIDEVQWDWQIMGETPDGENRTGIFAIKNDIVESALDHFRGEDVQVTHVQMAPMALYNYVIYDRGEELKSDNEAIVVLDIGAESSDLVVCTQSGVWQRSMTIGGNAFTRAIAETFKLNFNKAEKLKRTAPMSKYARQIFQAMKPVFSDLVGEVQRSLSFYNNSNPNVKLKKMLAFGGGTKLRGLLKYLQQSLQMPVEKPDSFKKLSINEDVSQATFIENVPDFGVVYGLGLQGLGYGRIESNLLPKAIARSLAWAGKTKFFNISAALLLIVAVLSLGRVILDRAAYSTASSQRQEISSIIRQAEDAERRLEDERRKSEEFQQTINEKIALFENRDIVPKLYQTVLVTLPNGQNNPDQQDLYEAFAAGDARRIIELYPERQQRRQIFITGMSAKYAEDISTIDFPELEMTTRRRTPSRTRQPSPDSDMSFDFGAPGMQQDRDRPSRDEEPTGDAKPGFAITIVGYSPYEDFERLMDPPRVSDTPERWGVVTRLQNLDQVFDGNNPFKLYSRSDTDHFRLEAGVVDADEAMPPGIGIASERETNGSAETVLIDPMTQEVISREPRLDDDGNKVLDRSGRVVYDERDRWFRLNFKLIWEDGEISDEAADDMRW